MTKIRENKIFKSTEEIFNWHKLIMFYTLKGCKSALYNVKFMNLKMY